MVKRHAEQALEDLALQNSPASKRARVDDLPEFAPKTNGLRSDQLSTNGHVLENAPQNEDLKLRTADEAEEELAGGEMSADSDHPPEQSAFSTALRQNAPLDGYTDLYLDTIDRSVLDFDFEKLCSVTLSNINVYACLVCGKYYQGRGPKSHAYFHALDGGHHVYVNMQTKRVYVLPEGYEVKSKSLEDIKFVVDPQYSK